MKIIVIDKDCKYYCQVVDATPEFDWSHPYDPFFIYWKLKAPNDHLTLRIKKEDFIRNVFYRDLDFDEGKKLLPFL